MDLPKVAWADVGSAVISLMASATRSAVVVAPFITDAAFRRLLEALPSQPEILVITQWTASDVAAGYSDTRILDRLAERSGRLLLHPRLHAKIYVADQRCALVGSANVTDTAFGFAPEPNREVLIELEPLPTGLLAFLRRIEREAVLASEEFRRAIEEAAARLQALPRQAGDEPPTPCARAVTEWYPSLRSPERLYTLYRSVDGASADEREAAIEDLAEIAVADGLDERGFCDAIAQYMASCPHLIEFDAFLAFPRRFGELTDWLKRRNDASLSHERSQRSIQTLIRWLLFFRRGRYALKDPHYSEVFGRREIIEDDLPRR
jgi:hypothetical protein